MKRGLEALKLYFVIEIDVVLLKKEMGANVDLKRRSTHCGDCQEDFRGVE